VWEIEYSLSPELRSVVGHNRFWYAESMKQILLQIFNYHLCRELLNRLQKYKLGVMVHYEYSNITASRPRIWTEKVYIKTLEKSLRYRRYAHWLSLCYIWRFGGLANLTRLCIRLYAVNQPRPIIISANPFQSLMNATMRSKRVIMILFQNLGK